MPEFEENQPKPDLNKEKHQYEPGQGTPTPSSFQASKQSSKPFGARRRSTRGPKPPFVQKEIQNEDQQKPLSPTNETDSLAEELYTQEPEEPSITRQEPFIPKSHQQQQKVHKTPTKPIHRKDVFIPKTKQESERHKKRQATGGKKGLWQRILNFFGLGFKSKTTRKHKPDSHEKSSRPYSDSFPKKRYPPRKHPAARKHPGKGPKSSF